VSWQQVSVGKHHVGQRCDGYRGRAQPRGLFVLAGRVVAGIAMSTRTARFWPARIGWMAASLRIAWREPDAAVAGTVDEQLACL
jgi:hypothetical protein